MKALSSRHTVTACYVGYITQAIVNNFAPLLFVTFQTAFDVSLTLLGMLITVNFGVQLCVDLLSAKIVDKLGYRPCMVAAHLFVAAGLLLFALLPGILPQPVVGLFIGSGVYAVGGGLIEVLVSPVVESCPTKNKKAAMSMLHSFYCWGHVAVVALSTLFFSLAGTEHWQVMACIWAAIPLCNAVYFLFVPLFPVVEEGKGMTIRKLFATPVFWLLFVLMFCAGSSEQAVSQWASAFAESGLHVSKVLGDLLGPCLFGLHGALAAAVFSVRRETAHAPFSQRCGARLYRRLRLMCVCARFTACARPDRLRHRRIFCRHSLAGDLFPVHRSPAAGRYGNVRVARARGRCRLRCGAERGRRFIRCPRRGSAHGDCFRHLFPAAHARRPLLLSGKGNAARAFAARLKQTIFAVLCRQGFLMHRMKGEGTPKFCVRGKNYVLALFDSVR